jgi:beta-carotene 3-hydroxylase
MTAVVAALAAFLVMEPAAAGFHRAVMHGRGWGWHRSHHARSAGPLEANDLFPLLFATLTVSGMAAAVWSGHPLVLAGLVGVTGYGLAYAVVHDVCVHGRLTGRRPVLPGRWLRRIAACHAIHHRTGEAPYGFLVPIVPAKYRPAVVAFRQAETRARRVKTS